MFTLILTIIFSAIILSLIVAYFFYGIKLEALFVPSSNKAVKKLLKLADIKEGDRVYDLGAGDGRLIHLATKLYKANAIGFEINPFAFFIAKIRQIFWGWHGQIKFKNFLHQRIQDGDVIFCYLSPKGMEKIQDQLIEALSHGSKIISYSFSIPSVEPLKVISKEKKISKIFIYKK